jgi:Mg-chelatase subunit ChlD
VKRKFLASIALPILTLLAIPAVLVSPAQAVEIIEIDASCADVEILWLRGSGQELGHSDFQKLKIEIFFQFKSNDISSSYKIKEVDYPAVEIAATTALGAKVSGGAAFSYGSSAKTGGENLKKYISSASSTCPETKFAIAGYSQGAQAVADVLGDLPEEKLLYVGLLGEPKLYLPEGSGLFAPACKGENFSAYRVFAPNCYTYKGSLGKRAPYYINSTLDGKVGLWCASHDYICGSSKNLLDNKDHVSYAKSGLILDLARAIRDKVLDAFPPEVAQRKIEKQAEMDTVIMIDTTASMDKHITAYRVKAKSLAAQVFAVGGRVALVEYRDFRDSIPNRILCDFSCSESEFNSKLNRVSGELDTGGGDTPEDLLGSLMTAYNGLDWRYGATKSIIVLTDAGYHSPDRSGVTYREVVERSLEIDPVNTYIITPSTVASSAKTSYENLARDTGGKYIYSDSIESSADLLHDLILSRPVAKLALEEYIAKPSEALLFDARYSYALDGKEIVNFEFDFNGDGVYDFSSSDGIARHSYGTDFEGFIVVKTTDEEGLFATMSAKVKITASLADEQSLLAPAISNVKKTTEDSLKLSFATEDAVKYVLIRLNGVDLGFVPSDLEEIELVDLDFSEAITVELVSLSAEFDLGGQVAFTVSPDGEVEHINDDEGQANPEENPPAEDPEDDDGQDFPQKQEDLAIIPTPPALCPEPLDLETEQTTIISSGSESSVAAPKQSSSSATLLGDTYSNNYLASVANSFSEQSPNPETEIPAAGKNRSKFIIATLITLPLAALATSLIGVKRKLDKISDLEIDQED